MKIRTSRTTVIDLRVEDIKLAVEHWMNTVHRVDVSKFQFDFQTPNDWGKPNEVVLTLSRTIYPSNSDKETEKETENGKEHLNGKEYVDDESIYDQ